MATLKTTKSITEMDAWADCRGTSIEIAEVIFEYATTEEIAERVWEAPTEFESKIIAMLAFDRADKDEDTLNWGEQTIRK